jgi:hypothetical protein
MAVAMEVLVVAVRVAVDVKGIIIIKTSHSQAFTVDSGAHHHHGSPVGLGIIQVRRILNIISVLLYTI